MKALNLAEQIKSCRTAKNITQEELAKVLGVTNQSVSKWEAGICCPDIGLLPDIADFFGITIDELLSHDTECNNDTEKICLEIKRLFENSPKDYSFSIAFIIAAILHEGALSRGYKEYIPWDKNRFIGDFSKELERFGDWSSSVSAEPEGETAFVGNGIFISDHKYYKKTSTHNIFAIYSVINRIDSIDTLKVMYALYELTAFDYDLYVSIDEIAEKSALSVSEAEKILYKLPITVIKTDDTRKFRLDGSFMFVPPLLKLLCVPFKS